MFVWALLFLAFAFLAALFGFTGLAFEAAFFAKIVCIAALVASAVSWTLHRARRA